MAHEINNPLAIILRFTDMFWRRNSRRITEGLPHPENDREASNERKAGGGETRQLCSHPESKEKDVDINKNIDEVLDVIGRTIILNKITTIKDFAPLLPAVRGVPGEFQQVFFNLINNALVICWRWNPDCLQAQLMMGEAWKCAFQIPDVV